MRRQIININNANFKNMSGNSFIRETSYAGAIKFNDIVGVDFDDELKSNYYRVPTISQFDFI